MSEDGQEIEDETIIPEEDFREAIAACRRDPELNRYFELAPPGAKLFIGLGFYSTYFGDKVDPAQYAECQAEIEPALAPNDLKYLIRFERDKGTKKYLRELLSAREAEESRPDDAVPAQPDAPVSLPRRKRRKKAPQPVLKADEHGGGLHAVPWFPLKVAAVVAALLGGAILLYFAGRPAEPGQVAPQVAAAAPADEQADKPAVGETEVPRAARGVRKSDRQDVRTYALVDADEEDARIHGAELQDGVARTEPLLPEDEPKAEETGGKKTVKASTRKQKVVLTDGRKIVRRPNGVIEVPRNFSCSGAGVKPFWVYSANPEAEAAKEKKAREEWQALVRQAGDNASGGGAAESNML